MSQSLKALSYTGVAAAAAGTAALLYGTFVERQWLQTSHVPIRIRKLPHVFDGYRIVHISDIHLSKWMTRQRIQSIATQVQQLQPDLIAITGDFVTGSAHNDLSQLVDGLKAFSAPDGVFVVPGNHDYRMDGNRHPNRVVSGSIDQVRDVFDQAGVCDLSNDVYRLQRGADALLLAGVDDVWAQRSRLDVVLEKLKDDDTPAVLLAHEPDFADVAAATGRFALQLSGHTHGGQIRLPAAGIVYKVTHGTRYLSGMYQVRDMALYVTRGVGTVGLPIRFLCRPEITMITLHPDR